MGFRALLMEADREHCSTHFFFKSSVLSEVELKSYKANDMSEFEKAKEPICFNLSNYGVLKGKDGRHY